MSAKSRCRDMVCNCVVSVVMAHSFWRYSHDRQPHGLNGLVPVLVGISWLSMALAVGSAALAVVFYRKDQASKWARSPAGAPLENANNAPETASDADIGPAPPVDPRRIAQNVERDTRRSRAALQAYRAIMLMTFGGLLASIPVAAAIRSPGAYLILAVAFVLCGFLFLPYLVLRPQLWAAQDIAALGDAADTRGINALLAAFVTAGKRSQMRTLMAASIVRILMADPAGCCAQFNMQGWRNMAWILSHGSPERESELMLAILAATTRNPPRAMTSAVSHLADLPPASAGAGAVRAAAVNWLERTAQAANNAQLSGQLLRATEGTQDGCTGTLLRPPAPAEVAKLEEEIRRR